MKKILLVLLSLLFCLCIFTACAHECEFATEWSHNETNHWHACTDESCQLKKDDAVHTLVTKYNADYSKEYKECSVCGYKSAETAHTHVGGTATCTAKAVCTACNQAYGEVASHTATDNAVWQKDASGHWKVCAGCDAKVQSSAHTPATEFTYADGKQYKACTVCGYHCEESTHSHSYVVETVSAESLKSTATCQAKAVYYKSCACGEIDKSADAVIFESGEKDAMAHVGTNDKVVSKNDGTHKIVWTCCENVIVTDNIQCSSQNPVADCTTAEQCVCEYETKAANTTHTLAIKAGSYDGTTHVMECTVVGCDHEENANHSFTVENKTATGALKTVGTCQAVAVYYSSCACGTVGSTETFNGEKDADNHTLTTFTYDKGTVGDDVHIKNHECCNSVADEDEACSGGSDATCTVKSVCQYCQDSYGVLAQHVYEGSELTYNQIEDANQHQIKCVNCDNYSVAVDCQAISDADCTTADKCACNREMVTAQANHTPEYNDGWKCSICQTAVTPKADEIALDADQSTGIDFSSVLADETIAKVYDKNFEEKTLSAGKLTYTLEEASATAEAYFVTTANGQIIKVNVTKWSQLVYSATDLKNMKDYEVVSNTHDRHSYIKLMDNITFSNENQLTAEDAIGYGVIYAHGNFGWKGVFDGNGKTIDGMKMGYEGMFYHVGEGAIIKNVNFTNAVVGGGDRAFLVRFLGGGTIKDVSISVSTGYDGAFNAKTAVIAKEIPESKTYMSQSGITLENVTITRNGDNPTDTLQAAFVCLTSGYSSWDLAELKTKLIFKNVDVSGFSAIICDFRTGSADTAVGVVDKYNIGDYAQIDADCSYSKKYKVRFWVSDSQSWWFDIERGDTITVPEDAVLTQDGYSLSWAYNYILDDGNTTQVGAWDITNDTITQNTHVFAVWTAVE